MTRKKKEYYAAVIQKLQGELGVGITPFPELKNLVVDFTSQNKELAEWASEEELSGDEILDLLLKGDNEFARKIRNEAGMAINRREQEYYLPGKNISKILTDQIVEAKGSSFLLGNYETSDGLLLVTP